MSRFHLGVLVHALVLTLASPAVFAFGEPTPDDPAAPKASTAPTPARPAPRLAVDASILAATARLAEAARPAQTPVSSPLTRPRPASKRLRAQGGGQMAMMLVSTVAGIAGTVYMLKYMRDQQKDTATEGSANRYR